ncbi:hypothetical protein ABPG74_018109 [Tetrahymena malaccensis]
MQEISQERDFNRITLNNFGKLIVITFYADWYDHSVNYVEQIANLQELMQIQDVVFCKCDAEKVPEVANKFQVSMVPTVVLTETRKTTIKKFENEVPAVLFEQIEEANKTFKNQFENEKERMYAKIKELLSQPGVLMFIKGTPQEPECKFTRELLGIIESLKIRFRYYDIIADIDMRHWLRHYNKWPTYPQIFIDGKLLGGLDVLKEHIAKNTLEIPASCKISEPKERLQQIIQEHKSILFMEGTPNDENLSENSKKFINLLAQAGIRFSVFNLSIDCNLKDYLKETYKSTDPYFFAGKQYVGNLEVVIELSKKQELLQKVPGSEWKLDGEQKIKYLLKACPVVIFMHGTPNDTKSEDSAKMIKILNDCKVKYDFYNVDADADVNQYLPILSNFDKIPQLYNEGELVGGIEVVTKLFNDDDLKILLQNNIQQ